MAKPKKSAKKSAKKGARRAAPRRAAKKGARRASARRPAAKKGARRRSTRSTIPARLRAQAISWFGVSHTNVPFPGTAAERKVVNAYLKSHKAAAKKYPEMRSNPYVTGEGFKLKPENCPIPLAASLLDARRDAKFFNSLPKSQRPKEHFFKIGKDGNAIPRTRISNCDYRSAQLALSQRPEGVGSKFKGEIREGLDLNSDWTTHSKKEDGSVMTLSYFYKKMSKPAAGSLFDVSVLGRWWPHSTKTAERTAAQAKAKADRAAARAARAAK